MESILNDWSCRILAYLGYASLTMISYSYAIQGLSRLFFIVFYKYRNLLHYKCHIIFIICQIFISLLISLPSLITKDVVFRRSYICFIPTTKLTDVSYFFISSYFVPLLIVIIVYVIIYCRVIKSTIAVRPSSHVTKRDIELIRNILILLIIFLIAGIPTVVYVIMSLETNSKYKALRMVPALGTSFAIIIEKICLIFLNKDIGREVKIFLSKLHLTRTSNHNLVYSFSSVHATNHKTIQSNVPKFENRIEDRRQIIIE